MVTGELIYFTYTNLVIHLVSLKKGKANPKEICTSCSNTRILSCIVALKWIAI